MRILHTLDYFAEGFGRPQSVYNLARLQEESGHEVEVVVGDCFGFPEKRAFSHFPEKDVRRRSIYRQKDVGWKEWLLGEVERIGPDIIHTHELADGWALAGNTSRPVVLSIHVDYRRRPEASTLLSVAKHISWVEYWNPDIAGWLLQAGLENVSWNCSPMIIPPIDKITKEPYLIASQGRVDGVKNQRLLLECMPEVLRFLPEAHLEIIGDGSERLELENLADNLGIRKRVNFLGWKEDPLPYLARAHLAAYPGFHMGFDRAITEAMALGVPTITSPELSPVIHWGKYGIVANKEDFGAAIIRALRDDSLEEKFAKPAREVALRQYSPRAVLRRTEAVYGRLL